MKEADEIYVLDTGSTDNSVNILKSLNVKVTSKKIDPWRFDVARNESLKLVPSDTDLYVCTDLDERFNPGWRKILEEQYSNKYSRVKYLYNWSFDNNGKPATTYYLDKIHTKDYKWSHPVHEVLTTQKEEKALLIDGIVLNHYQDYKKERSNYLPLLELSVKEDPEDDRNMHYLGREYMYYGKYIDAISTLHNHLLLKKATWKDERCASMRYIARCYISLGFMEEALMWYEYAIKEAPYLREGYVEKAILLYSLNDYVQAINALDLAFEIKEKPTSYINENYAWDANIYDLYAICNYYINKKDIAKEYSNKAISLNSSDERIKSNNLIINQDSM